jgi:hypothetical protein
MASTIKVNNIQNQCGANIANKCGTTITLGASGDTITLACGASQTGFGRTGTVDWDTTAKTASFTAVSGNGYFVNTTSGAITVTLPAGSAGDIVSLADYAATWQTNNVTVTPDGTDKIGGENENATLDTQGQSVTFVFVDSTQGWINTMDSTSNVRGAPPFIAATGGTIVTCGDFKTHIFTGPGTFCVTSAGTPAGSTTVEYLVVAGGGSAGTRIGGGGGAGGARVFETSPLKSPIVAPAGLTLSVQSYPITVGGGGTGQPYPITGAVACSSGSNSIFSTITSTGGGRGASYDSIASAAGGSGGGGAGYDTNVSGGNGNTPPVSPSQGNPGGAAFGNVCGPNTPGNFNLGGGGGGAEAAGTGAAPGCQAGPGGLGVRLSDAFIGPTAPSYGTSGPVPSTRWFAGGGGGGPNGAVPNGGGGGKGYGPCAPAPTGKLGIANTGGGGGSTPGTPGPDGVSGAGGSGIVMIRYKYQ